MSTPKITRPCFACTAYFASLSAPVCLPLNVATVPSGLISVMPQACSTLTPKSSWNVRIIAGGQAEPPITVARSVENFSLASFM